MAVKKLDAVSFIREVISRACDLHCKDDDHVSFVGIKDSERELSNPRSYIIPEMEFGLLLDESCITSTIENESLDKVIGEGFTRCLIDIYKENGQVNLMKSKTKGFGVVVTADVRDNAIHNIPMREDDFLRLINNSYLPVDFILA